VGTWNTQAEYKDVRVTAPDGKVLFSSDFSKGSQGWQTAGGQWSVVDGALRQSAGGEDIRAVAGDPSWTDYTLDLKARKLSGEEGFLILFQTAGIDNPTWWNLGGWRNTEHSLQGEGMIERHERGSIETNRWYDIRIESRAGGVKAYLDGKLIHEMERKPVAILYAAAGRDERTREIVLQLVNPFHESVATRIKLEGVRGLGSKARVITLSNLDDNAENTLERPDATMPRTSEFTGLAPEFAFGVEPYSVVTLRIPER
jgi:alpha-L-arabinofuranosidase